MAEAGEPFLGLGHQILGVKSRVFVQYENRDRVTPIRIRQLTPQALGEATSVSSTTSGRHRAPTVSSNPLTAVSKAVSSNAGTVGRSAAVFAATSGLILTAGIPAQAAESMDREALSTTVLSQASLQPATVTVPANVEVSFEREAAVVAESFQAPVVEAPTVAEQAVEAPETVETPAATPEAPAPAAEAAPAPETKEAPAPVASSSVGAALVASAYGQLGIAQDCTAMVEKALRSIGKSVGDIGPSGFYAYGTVVSNPAPGDLMITGGHVAIYVGNGQAISGGFNGFNTVLHDASVLSGATFVRVS